MIRPPEGLRYILNGRQIERARETGSSNLVLPTIIQLAPGLPIRSRRRRTDIHILEPHREQGWLYEMGIPIQPMSIPYDIDVMQKVPMPPNRDTVPGTYVKEIYTEVLNVMHQKMPDNEFSENWARVEVENPRIQNHTVRNAISRRFGSKVLMWSNDADAKMQAIDQGYQVIHPRSLSREEARNMRELGGMQRTRDLFRRADASAQIIVETPNDRDKQDFARWVQELGRMAGKEVTITFVTNPNAKILACCTMNTQNPEMRFNLSRLDEQWFRGRGAGQLEIIIHELGHSETDGQISHGPQWGRACTRVAGLIAAAIKNT